MIRAPATRITLTVAAASLSTMYLAPAVEAHPLCFYGPDRAVSITADATFCLNEDPAGFCCEPAEENALAEKFDAVGKTLSAECAPLYKEVLCGVCNPYSAHLYTRLKDKGEDGLAMTKEFCSGFFSSCASDLGLPATYCDEHVLDNSRGATDVEYWSYPLDIEGGFSDSDVTPAFPNLPEESLPAEPIAMQMTPDGSAWWIAGMAGFIKMADASDPSDAVDILDISAKIEYSYEQGLMGFAFSPSFTDTGLFYVSYTIPGESKPDNGMNVLSKFVYFPGDKLTTLDSEEVLITTTEKSSSVHSSGWVGFAPSSYADPTAAYHELYWSVGDGGPQDDPLNRAQDLTTLHGSIVRISVPSDGEATGYSIPTGNAFDGIGDERPEICAWGLRNPFRCAFDSATDALYCGDVGQDRVEEVNVIECGKDYGWRMFEGMRCNDGFESYDGGGCAALDRSDYAFPVFEYCHFDYDSTKEEYDACGDKTVTGLAVIGGHVYHGSKYADILGGHYIFADHSTGSLYHLAPAEDGSWTAGIILGSIPKLTGFAHDNEGELYLVGYKGNIYDLPCGDLCASAESSLSCMPQSGSVPAFEEIGCFNDGSPKSLTLTKAPECDGTMSAEVCASFCATVEGATYFGLQYQRECFCGGEGDDYMRYGDQLDDGECDMPCAGSPTQMCGGRDKTNVYAIIGEGGPTQETAWTRGTSPTAAPTAIAAAVAQPPVDWPLSHTYVGCYGDDIEARALTHARTESDTMSMEDCENFCSDAGASIFAMEHGRECFCGTDEADFELHGRSDSCDMPCSGSGNAGEMCGGYLAMSVYTMASPSGDGSISGTAPPTPSIKNDAPTPTSDSLIASSGGGMSSSDGAAGEHMGCYVDARRGRMLRSDFKWSRRMTPARCSKFCSVRAHGYFNVQYGTECWCGDENSFAKAIKADDGSRCDYPCGGDATVRCGGFLFGDVYKIIYR